MRALTVRQPWASLIAAGAKTIETRSWSTGYRGDLLIHAGKAWGAGWLRWYQPDDPMLDVLIDAGADMDEDVNGSGSWRVTARWSLPLGAVVAVARLVDVVPIFARDECLTGPGAWIGEFDHEGDLPHQRGGLWLIGPSGLGHGTPTRVEDQRPLGDFTPGRWAWLLDDVRPVGPISATGRQGLWTPDAELIAAVPSAGSEEDPR